MATLNAILAEFGIRALPANGHPKARETKATRMLARLLREHGEGHVRAVLVALVETNEGSAAALTQPVITATSDVLLVRPLDSDTLARLDGIDLRQLEAKAKRLAAVAPVRHALATLLADALDKAAA